MHDPREGLDAHGLIVTGVSRRRVPASFEPLLDDLVTQVHDAAGSARANVSLYLYGSVATGEAILGRSDVDVSVFGLDAETARDLSADLTRQHRHRAREVAIGVWTEADFAETDAGHGNRVFLKHYCAHLSGADLATELPRYRGDRRAARGFNGDLPTRWRLWRERLAAMGSADADPSPDLARLARGLARKTLFATAGLVSVHDSTWTTDRALAAHRWGELHPGLHDDLDLLLAWGDGPLPASGPALRHELNRVLDGPVARLCEQFVTDIGAWDAG